MRQIWDWHLHAHCSVTIPSRIYNMHSSSNYVSWSLCYVIRRYCTLRMVLGPIRTIMTIDPLLLWCGDQCLYSGLKNLFLFLNATAWDWASSSEQVLPIACDFMSCTLAWRNEDDSPGHSHLQVLRCNSHDLNISLTPQKAAWRCQIKSKTKSKSNTKYKLKLI